jgi:hypothetical protein
VTVEALGRVADLYRRTAASRSAVALVIANAIPLIGVLFFGWSLLTILVVYWVENGIVGFWNVPRLLLAQGSLIDHGTMDRRLAAHDSLPPAATPERQYVRDQLAAMTILGRRGVPGIGRAGMAAFFLVHYGIFWFVHGLFVFALPTFGGMFLSSGSGCVDGSSVPGFALDPGFAAGACGSPFGEVLWGSVSLATVALFISHGASFLLNYVRGGEYRTTSPATQLFAPYSRVVVLHLTILIGAFAVALLGAPVAALIVLIVLKTAYDLRLHLREHGAAGPPATHQPPA